MLALERKEIIQKKPKKTMKTSTKKQWIPGLKTTTINKNKAIKQEILRVSIFYPNIYI